MARRGQTREQRRPRHVAASDAGAAPLVLRLCFIVDNNVQIVIVVQDFNFLNARTQVVSPCSHISFFLRMTVFLCKVGGQEC